MKECVHFNLQHYDKREITLAQIVNIHKLSNSMAVFCYDEIYKAMIILPLKSKIYLIFINFNQNYYDKNYKINNTHRPVFHVLTSYFNQMLMSCVMQYKCILLFLPICMKCTFFKTHKQIFVFMSLFLNSAFNFSFSTIKK